MTLVAPVSYAYCSEAKAALDFDFTCCESCHVDHEDYGYNLVEHYPPINTPTVELVVFTCCGCPPITARAWEILMTNAAKELWDRAFQRIVNP